MASWPMDGIIKQFLRDLRSRNENNGQTRISDNRRLNLNISVFYSNFPQNIVWQGEAWNLNLNDDTYLFHTCTIDRALYTLYHGIFRRFSQFHDRCKYDFGIGFYLHFNWDHALDDLNNHIRRLNYSNEGYAILIYRRFDFSHFNGIDVGGMADDNWQTIIKHVNDNRNPGSIPDNFLDDAWITGDMWQKSEPPQNGRFLSFRRKQQLCIRLNEDTSLMRRFDEKIERH